jgi:hypothetical protein
MPASARGLVRNNILLPGPCSSAGSGYDVYELAAGASPRIIANNDFAPAPVLYHSNAMGDLTTLVAVDGLPGASNDRSVDPMLAVDGIHEQAGSMCIDHGTATGAPADDYDGAARPVGAGFDIGMDER